MMSKITIHELGKAQYTRDMTAEEEAVYEADKVRVQADKDAFTAKENKKKSGRDKLIGLGLTSEEVDALIGGITS